MKNHDSFVLLFMNNGLWIFYYVSRQPSIFTKREVLWGVLVCLSRKEIRLLFSLLIAVTCPKLISLNCVSPFVPEFVMKKKKKSLRRKTGRRFRQRRFFNWLNITRFFFSDKNFRSWCLFAGRIILWNVILNPWPPFHILSSLGSIHSQLW